MLADGVLAHGDSDLAELRLEAGVEAADFDRGEGAVLGLADNAYVDDADYSFGNQCVSSDTAGNQAPLLGT
jgi:hypothetical protein